MLTLGGKKISSRFLLGTAQYPSPEILLKSISAAKAEIITVSIRRQLPNINKNTFWDLLRETQCHILPNTAGCFTAKEAITTAKMARELFNTNWIKLEVMGDEYTLQPNPIELIKATETLIKDGFEVFPYCTDDLVICKQLIECGCKILMPLASPIGSGKGILNPYTLKLLRERCPDTTIIVDAGIGKPSDAAQAMELGVDAILLNTAVALATDPVAMASAFSKAIEAGRTAYKAGMMPERNVAQPSTPIIGKPFWHEANYD